VVLKVEGMSCAACVAHVEKALNNTIGVNSVQVNLSTGRVIVNYDVDKLTIDYISNLITDLGFHVISERKNSQSELDREQKAREDEINRQKRNMWFTWPFAIVAMIGTMRHMWGLDKIIPELMGNNYFLMTITAPVVFFGGWQFFINSWHGLKRGVTDMNLLYATGIGSSYLIAVVNTVFPDAGFGGKHATFYEAAAMLTAFIVLGRYLEALTRGKTSEAIRKLISLKPKVASVIRDNQEIEIPAEEVEVGDIISVKPGESIPVDGIVTEGYSAVDESMITGESIPLEKKQNDVVIGGTMNKTGIFKFSASRTGADTTLAQIISLVENAQGSKAPIQKTADFVAGHFIMGVHILSLVVFLFWFFIGFDIWFRPESQFLLSVGMIGQIGVFGFSMLLSLTVLVISCPCALGLATPSAIMAGSGKGAENGILFKDAEAIELISKLQFILFDKTGTLTRGEPSVTDIICTPGFKNDDIIILAAAAENGSEHPLGEAVVKMALEMGHTLKNPSFFEALPGYGIKVEIDNKNILLGNRRLLSENSIDFSKFGSQLEELEAVGKTVMLIAIDGVFAGLIAVADTLKDSSVEAIRTLHEMGIKVGMLTGDNYRTAKAIATQAGIDHVVAEVLPEDKANEVKKLQEQGIKVGMVGDGINDAPALATADIGIAIGSGTDVAKETGDIILIKGDLRDVVLAIEIGRATMRKARQNLWWAFGYNLFGIPIAAGILYPFFGWLVSPQLAGLFMALSSFSVTMNTLTLKGFVPRMKIKVVG
jgi:Cu+-exporting ATPase